MILTEQQFVDKYGEIEVTFDHYYKYCFYYTADMGDFIIELGYGCDADEIYRTRINSGETVTIEQMDWKFGSYSTKGGTIIDEFTYL